MANRRFIDFPIAASVGDNDIVLIWQDGMNKQTTKGTLIQGAPTSLEGLTDVDIAGLINGQILQYNSTTGKWENVDRTDINLSELGDVSIVSPTNGQVLVYNSSTSKWENSSGGFVPYVGAVTTVDLGAQGLRAGYVRFNTSVVSVPDEQGIMYWDADNETVDVILNGTIMQIGQDLFYPVKNQTGSTIPKGTAVRFAGTVGASGRLLIAPFIANNTVPSSRFMGVTSEAILDGADGKVMWFGRIRGINTNSFNEGDILYASTTTAGAFQTTIPVAPNNIVQVAAVVTKSINQGAIFVRPTIGSNINKDEGVKITSVADKDLLQYQSGTGLWENKTKAQILGGTSAQFVKGDGSLDSTSYQPLLTNPVTGTGTAGQVAFWNGTTTQTGDNGLFWDNTNKRLGIGTNAPTQKVEITGTGDVISILRSTSSTGIAINKIVNNLGSSNEIGVFGSTRPLGFGAILPNNGYMFSTVDLAIGSSTNLKFSSGVANTERIRVFGSTGNVLIQNGGTFTDAGFKLDVNGTARVQGVLTTTADAVVNGVNVGRGGGSIANNTRIGNSALLANTSGANNTAIGQQSLGANTTGLLNTAVGVNSGFANLTGNENSFFGVSSGNNIQSGNQNVFLGRNSGRFLANGVTLLTIANNSVLLGVDSRTAADNQTNQIVIGHTAIGLGSNTTVLGNTSTTHGRWYGSLLLGTNTNSTFLLDVNGTARFSGNLTVTATNATGDFATIDGSNILRRRTSAQVLTDIGAQAALTNPVTGTGTTNYLPKFTGSTTIGNSLFIDTGSNAAYNNAGVLSRTFVIQATSGRPLALEVIENANVHGIYFWPNNSGFNRISSDYMSGGVFLPLSLTGRENNADLVLQTSGNVTIGTTTDAGFKLDVNGTGRFSGNLEIVKSSNPYLIINDSGVASTGGILFQPTGFNAKGGLTLNFATAEQRLFTGEGGNTYFQTFYTNGVERLRITPTGNVGIGTSSPSDFAALTLVKNGESAYSSVACGNSNSTATLFVGVGGSSVANTALRNNAYLLNASNSALIFGTNDTERMRITSGGNVLIGTTTDGGQRLQVNGAIKSIVSSGGSVVTSESTATNGEGQFVIIGKNSSGTTRSASFKYDNADIIRIGTSSSIDFRFETNDTERMRITSGGNLLIGTGTNGSSRLKIVGLPTSAAGLSSGDVYNLAGVLMIA
jgi:uncharacterized protein YaiE (UPF0345 family)